jgi:spectinomycin phosphotransferase
MIETISSRYRLNVSNISEQEGGWASRAYRIDADEGCFFLKAYPKSRTSTPKWTKSINAYVPILLLLNETMIANKIIKPVRTIENSFHCEDIENIYLLFEYIEGETIGERQLNECQVDELADIISFLHHFSLDAAYDFSALKEDFDIPFNHMLKDYLMNENKNAFQDLRERIDKYRAGLFGLILELDALAEKMKNTKANFVLCHTDIHNWNMMQTKKGLVLLDWEGLRYSPPEADLFCICQNDYFDRFFRQYQKRNGNYVIDCEMLQFYLLRRKSEDIWEFIEQLQYDAQSLHDRKATLLALENELDNIECSNCQNADAKMLNLEKSDAPVTFKE